MSIAPMDTMRRQGEGNEGGGEGEGEGEGMQDVGEEAEMAGAFERMTCSATWHASAIGICHSKADGMVSRQAGRQAGRQTGRCP